MVKDLFSRKKNPKARDFFQFTNKIISKEKKKNSQSKHKNEVDVAGFSKIEKKYELIIVDPPWKYNRTNVIGSVDNEYDTLDIEELFKLPVWKIAAKNCIMFMWITHTHTQEGLDLIKKWRFAFKNWGIVWLKTTKNNLPHRLLGFYLRHSTELIWYNEFNEAPVKREISPGGMYLATRGEARKKLVIGKNVGTVLIEKEKTEIEQIRYDLYEEDEKYDEKYQNINIEDIRYDWFDVIRAPLVRSQKSKIKIPGKKPEKKHSRKPMKELEEKMKALFGENYENMNKIELFARTRRDGYDCWGNEIKPTDDDGKYINYKPKTEGFFSWLEFECQRIQQIKKEISMSLFKKKKGKRTKFSFSVL